MSLDDGHASRLERLVALHDGSEGVRRAFADASLAELEAAIADAEEAQANIARRGRLASDWADGRFEIVDADKPAAA